MSNTSEKQEPQVYGESQIYKGLYTDYAVEGAGMIIYRFLTEHQGLFDDWVAKHKIDPKGGLNNWFTKQKWLINAGATLTRAFEKK